MAYIEDDPTVDVLVGWWTNAPDIPDGIYWTEASEGTLFAAMEKYLTTGQTMEIVSYMPGLPTGGTALLVRDERKAHKVHN